MSEPRKPTRAAQTLLTIAGLGDIALGLAFLFAGGSLFGLAADIALIVGILLIASGVVLLGLSLRGRRRGRRAPDGSVVER